MNFRVHGYNMGEKQGKDGQRVDKKTSLLKENVTKEQTYTNGKKQDTPMAGQHTTNGMNKTPLWLGHILLMERKRHPCGWATYD